MKYNNEYLQVYKYMLKEVDKRGYYGSGLCCAIDFALLNHESPNLFRSKLEDMFKEVCNIYWAGIPYKWTYSFPEAVEAYDNYLTRLNILLLAHEMALKGDLDL